MAGVPTVLATIYTLTTAKEVFALSDPSLYNGLEHIVYDLDDKASIYCEGDLRLSCAENEGILVVNKNLILPNNSDNRTYYSVAGRVMWGMNGNPHPRTTSLVVGGNVVFEKYTDIYTSGPAQIGGNKQGNGNVYIAKRDTLSQYVPDPNDAGNLWDYSFKNSDPSVAQAVSESTVRWNMGQNALIAPVEGKAPVDYRNYKQDFIVPLSDLLEKLPITGTVSVAQHRVQDHPIINLSENIPYINADEDLLVCTGDNKSSVQHFSFTMAQIKALQKHQNLSLSFMNIPEDAIIILSVTDGGSINVPSGWKLFINGESVGTSINYPADTFRRACSRIAWNFPNATHVNVDIAHGILSNKTQETSWWVGETPIGQDIYGTLGSEGVLFTGTMLLPNATLSTKADLNGHILIGGEGTSSIEVWEHHNTPWRLELWYDTKGHVKLHKSST